MKRRYTKKDLRAAVENVLDVYAQTTAPLDPAVVLALCNVLNIINQKKDD